MAVDPLSSESNFIYSIDRHIMTNLGAPGTVEIPFIFDAGITPPEGTTSEESRWVAVNYGAFNPEGVLNTRNINLFPCARKDMGSKEVAELTDSLVDIFSDNTNSDNYGRVPIYDASDINNPEELGLMTSEIVLVSGHLNAEDGTKYQQISIALRWGGRL